MIVLMRPTLKAAISKPNAVIFAWLRRAIEAKPMFRALLPSTNRRNWACLTEAGPFAAGTVQECGTSIFIEILDVFEVNGLQFRGKELAHHLHAELSKLHVQYPYTMVIKCRPEIQIEWMSASGAGKGNGSGTGTGGKARGRGGKPSSRSGDLPM